MNQLLSSLFVCLLAAASLNLQLHAQEPTDDSKKNEPDASRAVAKSPETEKPKSGDSQPSLANAADNFSDDEAQKLDQAEVLSEVSEQMRKVQSLLEERKFNAQNQDLQQQIVAQLQSLLDQQKQQQDNSTNQNQSEKPEQQEQPEDSDLTGNKSKTQSDTSKGDSEEFDQQDRLSKQMQDKIWGHLPERVRDRMQNVEVEKFLPKYEQLIKSYYRRLAKEFSDR